MLALADVAPMLLTDRRPPPPERVWLFELKHDGYRVLARIVGGKAELRTRNGANCTAWYPEVVRGLESLQGRHILDGEACVLDDVGRPDFERLQERSRRRRWYAGCDPVAFLVFDLLVYRGVDIRAQTLEWRKATLQRLLTPAPHGVLYVGHLEEGGAELYAHACALQLEGHRLQALGVPLRQRPAERRLAQGEAARRGADGAVQALTGRGPTGWRGPFPRPARPA